MCVCVCVWMASPTESTSSIYIPPLIGIDVVCFGSFLRAFDMTSLASIFHLHLHLHAMRCDALQLWLWREVDQVQILCWYFLINLISIDDGAKSSAYITWKLHYTFLSSPPPPPPPTLFSYRMRESSAKIVRDAKWQQEVLGPFDFPLCVGVGRFNSHTTSSTPSVLYSMAEEDSLTWHIMCSKIFEAIALLSADIISPPAEREREQPSIHWKNGRKLLVYTVLYRLISWHQYGFYN